MIRHPPLSPLFPYPTLFRSSPRWSPPRVHDSCELPVPADRHLILASQPAPRPWQLSPNCRLAPANCPLTAAPLMASGGPPASDQEDDDPEVGASELPSDLPNR